MVRAGSTRSSARLASLKPNDASTPIDHPKEEAPVKDPPKKKAVKAKSSAPKSKATVAKKEEDDQVKKETGDVNAGDEQIEEVEKSAAESEEKSLKTVFIEASKECNAFKTRAAKIAEAVGSRAKVLINQEKPGKGNFVILVSGVDEPIIELKGMKRPFPPLKALDMDEVATKVLKALE